jgi:hypothetical protein
MFHRFRAHRTAVSLAHHSDSSFIVSACHRCLQVDYNTSRRFAWLNFVETKWINTVWDLRFWLWWIQTIFTYCLYSCIVWYIGILVPTFCRNLLPPSSTSEMEVESSSKMLVSVYQTAWFHIPEYSNKLLTFRGLSKSWKHFTQRGNSITRRFTICTNNLVYQSN